MIVLKVLQEILSTPALLVGIMALIGLLLQKKPIEDVVKGTIKTIVGFLVLTAGSSFLQSGSLNDFGTLFNFAFNVQGVVPNNEAVVSLAMTDYAGPTALIMCFGMVANIIMARFSRWNYIFLSGHVTLYLACMIAVVLSVGGLSGPSLIVAGSLVLGLAMAMFPAVVQKTMTKVTGTDDIGFGHFSTVAHWISIQVSKLVSRKDIENDSVKSTEDINFPKRISFLRDTTVAISVTMLVLFLIVTGIAVTKPGFTELDTNFVSGGYSNWFIYAIVSGLNFAGGIYIILSGVRMVLAEIVPAFRGIADKLVPNAKAAIDCPVLYPYAPNAVLIGFLVSFAGGVVGMFILYGINAALATAALPLILPGVVPHFFCGASAGVFTNAEGGLKGCIVGTFVHGIVITLLPALLMPVLGALNFAGATFSDADMCATGLVLGNIARFVQGNMLLAVCVVLFALPIIYNFVAPKKKVAEAANE